MILVRLLVAHPVPDGSRHVAVEARQHDGPLRQSRHGLHQQARGTARSGGACDDDRVGRRRDLPPVDHRLHDQTLPRRQIGRVDPRTEIIAQDVEELQRPLPMPRLVADIQIGQPLRVDTFAVHLVHQQCEAIRQIVKRRARGKFGRGIQQATDGLRQLQPAPQARDGDGQTGQRPFERQIGHKLHARQQARGTGVKDIADAPLHARGVHEDPHTAQVRAAVGHAAHEGAGEIDAGLQAEDAGMACRVKHRVAPAGLRPGRCCRGGPRRTSRRRGRFRKARRARPSRPR